MCTLWIITTGNPMIFFISLVVLFSIAFGTPWYVSLIIVGLGYYAGIIGLALFNELFA